MTVVIRVDSSVQIGSGHLMRCLTLAERLRIEYNASVLFVCRDLPGNLAALVKQQGFGLSLLPNDEDECKCSELAGYAAWLTVSQEQDAADTFAVIDSLAEPVDVLVVDSYAIDVVWERRLRPYIGCLLAVDDLANRAHDCDVLLDQNFHSGEANRYDGLVPMHCRLLLGPRYALLREEFYAARKILPRRQGELRRVLVFYGGSDPTDETSKAVRALQLLRAELPLDFTATVIVGGSNVRREAVRKLCIGSDWLGYYCQVDNMAEFMANADLMLSAGGTTTWERCYLGLPALVTAIADNQLPGCEEYAEAGLQIYLGRADEVTEYSIIEAIKHLTREKLQLQSEAGLRIMEGNVNGFEWFKEGIDICKSS